MKKIRYKKNENMEAMAEIMETYFAIKQEYLLDISSDERARLVIQFLQQSEEIMRELHREIKIYNNVNILNDN